MLISRVWLESLFVRPPSELTDAQLGQAMTSLGLEVEGVHRYGDELGTIRVARVEEVGPHPKADKLTVVQLHDGASVRQVVCGAPNVPAPGGKVAFAPVGAVLPGGLEIAGRELRGVASEGMICAEDELGIGPDSDGILILPEAWSAGDRLVDRVRGIADTVFELGVTPNRPDALGHVGVARDLAVKLGLSLRAPGGKLPEVDAEAGLVRLEAPERCGRYIGRTFEAVEVAPSPLWLRVRLHRVGLRPINNVVDITNFVLFEWGQPLHAFDRDRLREGRVVVRPAMPGETLDTLDGRTLELDPDDLVIADGTRPAALAGVMGGASSGVDERTKRVLLEAAWFHPPAVRRTARRHQISTDSSYRFERGVGHGPNLTAAAARAVALLQELTGARPVAGEEALGHRPEPRAIALRPSRTALLLGMDIPDDKALRILTGLGVEVDRRDPGRWLCVPPTHRPDLTREEDLIEELMRHHGLDALPAVPTVPSSAPRLEVSEAQRAAEAARELDERTVDALREAGLHQQISMVFCAAEELAAVSTEFPLHRAVRLSNPMRAAAELLRTHMLPGLLRSLQVNVARHTQPVRLFEHGRIYGWPESPGTEAPAYHPATASLDAMLPLERRRAALLLCEGTRRPSVDPREAGRILVGVLDRLGLEGRLLPCPADRRVPWLHPGVQAWVGVPTPDAVVPVGRFGACHPDLLGRLDLPEGLVAAYGELWIEALPSARVPQYRPISAFPSTWRDLSVDLAVTVPASAVIEALVVAERGLAATGEDPARLVATSRGQPAVQVVEDYRGAGVVPGRRALLLRLAYGAGQRSVTDSEVQARHEQVVEQAIAAVRRVDPLARPR